MYYESYGNFRQTTTEKINGQRSQNLQYGFNSLKTTTKKQQANKQKACLNNTTCIHVSAGGIVV